MEPLKYRNFFVKCPYCDDKSKVSFEVYELFYCPKCTFPYSFDRQKGIRKAKVYNLFCNLFTIFILLVIPIMLMTAIEVAFGFLFIYSLSIIALAIIGCYIILGEQGRKLCSEVCEIFIWNTRRKLCCIRGIPDKSILDEISKGKKPKDQKMANPRNSGQP